MQREYGLLAEVEPGGDRRQRQQVESAPARFDASGIKGVLTIEHLLAGEAVGLTGTIRKDNAHQANWLLPFAGEAAAR